MKVLKVIARICFVLALAALIAGVFVPSGYVLDGSGTYYTPVYATLDSIVVVAITIGVVSEFVDESSTFKKVGLALLIAGAIGTAGVGFTSSNYPMIVAFALVTLGLLFEVALSVAVPDD